MNTPPENDTAFQRAQSITAGILSAATKYLPHLIGVCGIAIAGASYAINHSRETQDTKTIWQHSGEWNKRYDEQEYQSIICSNYLQMEIDDLKSQLQNQKTKTNE